MLIDYDFNSTNDMEINFNNVPVTKHGAQTFGAQTATPKCHVPYPFLSSQVSATLSPPCALIFLPYFTQIVAAGGFASL